MLLYTQERRSKMPTNDIDISQLSHEQLLSYVQELRSKVQSASSTYAPSLSQQLDRIDANDPTQAIHLYEVKNAPYIIIGDAVYRQMKQRRDKRYHISYLDGTDGFLLLSDIAKQALEFNIVPLQAKVTQSRIHESNDGGSGFES